MKKLIILALLLSLAGCSTASYQRTPDGAITSEGGSVIVTYQPDGKTILSESFIPMDQSTWMTKAINGMTGSLTTEKLSTLMQLMGGGVAK